METERKSSEDENIIFALRTLFDARKLIFYSSTFFMLIFLVYSFFLSNYYESYSLLKTSNSNSSAQTSSLEALGSLAGLNVQEDSDSLDLAIETMKSRDFFEILYDQDMKINDFFNVKNKKDLPKFEDSYSSYLDALEIDIDRNTGFVKISVFHASPTTAKDFLDEIVLSVNLKMKEEKKEETKKSLDFLKSELTKTENRDLKSVISQLAQKKLEVLTLTNISDFYALQYIDSPRAPNKKAGPNRIFYTLLGLFIGFALSIVYVLSRYYYEKLISLMKD